MSSITTFVDRNEAFGKRLQVTQARLLASLHALGAATAPSTRDGELTSIQLNSIVLS